MELEEAISKETLLTLLKQLQTAIENDADTTIETDSLTINLSNNFSCELEYDEEDGEAELEIELKWQKTPNTTDKPAQSGATAPTDNTNGHAASQTPSTHRQGRFELFRGKNDEWYFHLKAPNNQIILASEGYTTKANAEKGIASVKANASDKQFERKTSRSKQPYFVLKAKNGQIIGVSQMYKRCTGCEKGVRSVIKHCDAEICEL